MDGSVIGQNIVGNVLSVAIGRLSPAGVNPYARNDGTFPYSRSLHSN
jgi:hypothetical protein